MKKTRQFQAFEYDFQQLNGFFPLWCPEELLFLIKHTRKDQLQPVALIEEVTVHCTQVSDLLFKKTLNR
jgi:hypothetical protein